MEMLPVDMAIDGTWMAVGPWTSFKEWQPKWRFAQDRDGRFYIVSGVVAGCHAIMNAVPDKRVDLLLVS